ncbi:hypothetical protein HYV91_02555 [Candidatus Wolfebacteria bacterium]|nr:hypothetical protein [Candidatus Wolfebacteria bacterium]
MNTQKYQKISISIYKYLLISVSIFFLIANVVLAQTYDADQAARDLARGSPIDRPEKVFLVLKKILQWTYTIFFIMAVYFLLLAAFTYLSASGNPEKIKAASSQLLWGMVAIAVALISVGAAAIIRGFLTP